MDTRVRTIDAPRAASPSAPRPAREFSTRNPGAASRRDAYNTRRAEASTSATSTGVLRGRVLRHGTDEPLAGASITAAAKGNNSPLGPWSTSADGAFEATALPAGELRFSVKDAAGKPLYDPSRESNGAARLLLKSGETTETVLRVFEGYTITGLVYDKETSEPLKGAKISLADNKVPPAISGDDGRYTLTGVPPQMGHNIQADLAGFVIQGDSGTYTALPADTFTVKKNIPMVPSVLVKGQVVNAAGDGISGAKLNWSSNASLETPSAISDANGYFQFPVEPLRDGSLVIEASGYAWKRRSVTVRNEDVTDLRIVLEKAAKIIGKVIDPESHGVADASITVEDTYSIAFSRMNSVRQVARSSTDGTFTADDIASGTYTLTARADGHAPGTARVTVREGQTTTGVEIRLGKELTIEGRVVDGNDKPLVANVTAMVGSKIVPTDSNGHFTIGGLPPGEVMIWVTTEKPILHKDMYVEAGTKDLVIRFSPMANIHCRVIDSVSKQPINEFQVTEIEDFSREGEPPYAFCLSKEPGHGTITFPRITAEGYASKKFEIKIPDKPGDFQETLELGVGGGIVGRIVDINTGEPVKDVVLSKTFMGRDESQQKTSSDEAGKFNLVGLDSGKSIISFIPPSPFSTMYKTFEIHDGEITDVGDIKIGGPASLLVRIRTADDKPLAGVPIIINFQETHTAPQNKTDTNGECLYNDLPPGEFQLIANSCERIIELGPSENRIVEIKQGAVNWTGTVSVGGKPLEQGVINIFNSKENTTLSGYIRQGRFNVPHLSSGDYTVTIKGPRSETSFITSPIHTEDITIPDGPAFVKNFALP